MTDALDRIVLGGTFDPIHGGHLAMMTYVLENNVARYLDVIPAAVSPFKSHVPPMPARFRLEMVNLAVGTLDVSLQSRVLVRDIELHRAPPSYTIDTLERLCADFPGESIGLLLGSDALQDFSLWLRPDEILERFPVHIFRREGEEPAYVERECQRLRSLYDHAKPRIAQLDNPTVGCSSTELRRLLRVKPDNSVIRDCLPTVVWEYIRRHGLYSESHR